VRFQELEFDEFTPQLKAFLEQHRTEERKKKRDKDAKKLQAAEAAEQAELAQAHADSGGIGEEGGQDGSGNKGNSGVQHSGNADLDSEGSPRKKHKPNLEGEKNESSEKSESVLGGASSSVADGKGKESGSEGVTGVAEKGTEEKD